MTRARAAAGLRRTTVTLLAAWLVGCSPYDETVELYVPLHRLQLPEPPLRRLSAGPAAAPKTARLTLTYNQSSRPPDTTRPVIEDDESPLPIVAVEFYPLSRLGIGYDYADYGAGSHGTLRAKAHLLGPGAGRAAAGDVSLAATFAYADKDYDAQGFSAATSLDSETRDYGLIAGWRSHRWLLLFGGPFNHRQRFEGTQTSSTGDFPRRRHVVGVAELTGYNAGFSINPGVRWMSIIAEYSSGRIEAGESRERVDSINAALRFNFGWRIDPSIR